MAVMMGEEEVGVARVLEVHEAVQPFPVTSSYQPSLLFSNTYLTLPSPVHHYSTMTFPMDPVIIDIILSCSHVPIIRYLHAYLRGYVSSILLLLFFVDSQLFAELANIVSHDICQCV